MYKLFYTNHFKKDVKLCRRRHYDMELLKQVIRELEKTGTADASMNPHKLSGNYKNYWELHIKGDWLLIYKKVEPEKHLWFIRTGTHSDLF